MKFKEVAGMLKPKNPKKMFGMLCLAMISTKVLSGCSQDDINEYSQQISEATGLDGENLATVATGITNGAKAVDTGATNAMNLGLSAAAGVVNKISDNSSVSTPDAPMGVFDENGNLQVHFIDVGQGDSILLSYEDQDGNTAYALIDAGDNDKGTTVQKYLMEQGVEKLDYLFLTHNHADHIGGADVIISKFDVDHVYMSADPADSKTYRDVIDALKYRSYKWEVPEEGQTMMLGAAELSVLASPSGNKNLNNDSIVVKATYGDSSFLFMGDAEFEEEEELLQMFADVDATLDVDVLKAGHHGSYTASSSEFIAEVTPQWTVISCGMDNEYGHPHNTSLYNFADYESDLFRTDIQGTIVCTTDGVEYNWNLEPTENWKCGDEITEDDYEMEDR